MKPVDNLDSDNRLSELSNPKPNVSELKVIERRLGKVKKELEVTIELVKEERLLHMKELKKEIEKWPVP